MYCISFNDIIELNGLLKDQGLHFRIHLRDACGKQFCWIEPLGNCACEGHFDEMYQVLENFFAGKRACMGRNLPGSDLTECRVRISA